VKVATAWIAVVLGIAAETWYCLQIVRGTIAPALATWLIFGVATTISLASYLKHPRDNTSFAANLANRLDPVVVWIIVAFIVFAPRSDKSLHAFDFLCFALSGMIIVAWAKSGSAFWANILIQIVMLLSYLPTCYKMIHRGRNTESFVMWGLSLIIALLFLVTSARFRDRLAMLYAGRAAASVAVILLIMLYLQFHGLR
jgi:hypothetical protein